MHLFNDVVYINEPNINTNVVFSCDNIYFQDYGINNIESCLKSELVPHCHIINPSSDTKQIVSYFNSKNVSFSFETLDLKILNKYQLKTYYYCSRFFISKDLFEKFNIIELWITDADVIFNRKPTIPKNKSLGISYNSDQKTLWKQTQANLIYVKNSKKDFIDAVISEYKLKLENTDFNILERITDKYERGNILGLDQVCMSIVLSTFYKDNLEFINLHDIPNLKSKSSDNCAVTILIGKNKFKNLSIDKYLHGK